jgi:hypothetical protein
MATGICSRFPAAPTIADATTYLHNTPYKILVALDLVDALELYMGLGEYILVALELVDAWVAVVAVLPVVSVPEDDAVVQDEAHGHEQDGYHE